MRVISRRKFLELGLGLPLFINQFSNSKVKEVRLEDLIDENYYFNLFKIKDNQKLRFKVTPKLAGFLDIGFMMNGSVGFYYNSDDKKYQGQVVIKINTLFSRETIIHASKGNVTNEEINIPEATLMLKINDDWVSYTNINYNLEYGVATFIDGKNSNEHNDIETKYDVDIKEALLDGCHIEDLVSGISNIRRYKEKITKNGSLKVYIVARENKKEKPKLYPIIVNLERDSTNNYPSVDDMNKLVNYYPLNSDFSRLFGRNVPIIAKGFMDENFTPLVADIVNFIPGIILNVTRDIIIPMEYKDK